MAGRAGAGGGLAGRQGVGAVWLGVWGCDVDRVRHKLGVVGWRRCGSTLGGRTREQVLRRSQCVLHIA